MAAKTYRQMAEESGRPHRFTVMKSDDGRRLVFGWANVAFRTDGGQIVDWQQDAIDAEDLEKAAYDYVADFGGAGEMHRRGGVGRVVESVVFTKEKADALGIRRDALPQGWWIGFKITDDGVWEKIKSGEYAMFSIEGRAVREPMEGGGK